MLGLLDRATKLTSPGEKREYLDPRRKRRLPDKSIVTNKDAGQRERAIVRARPRSLTGAIAFIGAIRISTPGFFASFPGALRDGPFPEVTAYLDHVRFGPMIRYRRRAKNADVLFLFDHLVGTR